MSEILDSSCRICGKVYDVDFDAVIPQCQCQPHVLYPNFDKRLLGNEVGKISFCSECEKLTLNVPGLYLYYRPIEDDPSLFRPQTKWNQEWVEWYGKWHNGEIEFDDIPDHVRGHGDNPIKSVAPTLEQLQNKYYGCVICYHSKWHSEGCDCCGASWELGYLVGGTAPVYGWDGAMSWENQYHCGICGNVYWMSDGN